MAGERKMFRVLEVPERKLDVLDVRDAIAATVDGMCEHFGLSGPEQRAQIYMSIAREARDMAVSL